jgi:IS1 family transposase
MRRFPPHVRRTQDNKIWLLTAVDHFQAGILGWVMGDHSAKTFEPTFSRLFRTKNNIAEKKLQETVKSESAYW